MTRVATFSNYQSALLDLMSAQSRAQQAQERIDSGRIATDMAGYGRQSESITSLKSTQARLQGFVEAGKTAAGRLDAQNLAMGQVYAGGTGAREAIANALSAGKLDSLMGELGLKFQTMQSGLNGSFQGQYLFAGGRTDALPATAKTLSDLTAAATVNDVFANDTLKHKYVGTWIDSWGTHLSTYEGTADPSGKSMSYTMQTPNPVTGAMDTMTMTHEFVDENMRVSRMWRGKEAKGPPTFEITYTRM